MTDIGFIRLYQMMTPQPAPDAFRIRRVRIPDTIEWLARADGVIDILAHEEYWRDGQTGAIDISTAAFIGFIIEDDYFRSDGFMIGTIVQSATATPPPFTLLCDGSTYERMDFPLLYAALASAFIVDADNFKVPDMRRRVAVGVGGDYIMGKEIGAESINLTVDQLAAHSHSNSPHTHSESIAVMTTINGGLEAPAFAAVPSSGLTGSSSVVIDSTGSGNDIDIRNPAIALNYYIYAE